MDMGCLMIPGKWPDNPENDEDSVLNVSVDTVSFIIARSQEAWVDSPYEEGDEFDVTERRSSEAGFSELAQFIDSLNEDERIDLVCLMWLGRSTITIEEFEQARREAMREATQSTADYLLSTPLIADYLAEGLEAFGFSVEEG